MDRTGSRVGDRDRLRSSAERRRSEPPVPGDRPARGSSYPEDVLAELAVLRAQTEQVYQRWAWQFELEGQEIGVDEHEGRMRHQRRMDAVAEWSGVLDLLLKLLLVVLVVLAILELAKGHGLAADLIRAARGIAP